MRSMRRLRAIVKTQVETPARAGSKLAALRQSDDHRLLRQLLGARGGRAAADEVGDDARREVLEQDGECLAVAVRRDRPHQLVQLLARRHRSPASLRRHDGQPRRAGRGRPRSDDAARDVHPASTTARRIGSQRRAGRDPKGAAPRTSARRSNPVRARGGIAAPEVATMTPAGPAEIDPARSLDIAVVGSGISGLAAAWLLAQRHRVTLYEADARLGGHSHTVEVAARGKSVAVDTGFIVYNEPAYPNLTALFAHLGVATQASEMSFAVSLDDGALEYSGSDLRGLFAQRGNLVNLRFWSMLRDLVASIAARRATPPAPA
jgi:hypothetical protein